MRTAPEAEPPSPDSPGPSAGQPVCSKPSEHQRGSVAARSLQGPVGPAGRCQRPVLPTASIPHTMDRCWARTGWHILVFCSSKTAPPPFGLGSGHCMARSSALHLPPNQSVTSAPERASEQERLCELEAEGCAHSRSPRPGGGAPGARPAGTEHSRSGESTLLHSTSPPLPAACPPPPSRLQGRRDLLGQLTTQQPRLPGGVGGLRARPVPALPGGRPQPFLPPDAGQLLVTVAWSKTRSGLPLP